MNNIEILKSLSSIPYPSSCVYEKYNIDDLSLVTSSNVISINDINPYITTMTSSITYLSCLAYNQDFSDFWEDDLDYTKRVITINFPRVRTINRVSGDVWGVSGIILNGLTYFPDSEGKIDGLPELTTKNRKLYNDLVVTSFNGKHGHLSSATGVKINGKDIIENSISAGIYELGNNYKFNITQYVTSFNNLTGDVYGLYSIDDVKPDEYGKLDYYNKLSNDLNENYIKNWALSSNYYLSGIMTLENQPSETDDKKRIASVGYMDKKMVQKLINIKNRTIILSAASFNLTNKIYTLPLSKIETEDETKRFRYKYVSINYVVDSNSVIYFPSYLQNDNNNIYMKFDHIFPSNERNKTQIKYLVFMNTKS